MIFVLKSVILWWQLLLLASGVKKPYHTTDNNVFSIWSHCMPLNNYAAYKIVEGSVKSNLLCSNFQWDIPIVLYRFIKYK